MSRMALAPARASLPLQKARVERPSLTELTDPMRYLARNSRSFRFAASLLGRRERDRVARVYAWCRFTDDLADRCGQDRSAAGQRLDGWLAMSQAAYEGAPSGVAFLDRVMGEMAEHSVPFAYAAELGAGVRSDLLFTPYHDLSALRVYTRRVAGTVGCWLTELHDVRDPWMLERAATLGDAMQLTNILRDVGEDWGEGRLYLPLSTLARHDLAVADIDAMYRDHTAIDSRYRALIEDLIEVANESYRTAREAIPYLPQGFRRAVSVAAAVYQEIHSVIRRNGYDNLHRRAVTSTAGKLAAACRAWVSELWFARR